MNNCRNNVLNWADSSSNYKSLKKQAMQTWVSISNSSVVFYTHLWRRRSSDNTHVSFKGHLWQTSLFISQKPPHQSHSLVNTSNFIYYWITMNFLALSISLEWKLISFSNHSHLSCLPMLSSLKGIWPSQTWLVILEETSTGEFPGQHSGRWWVKTQT